MMLENWLMPFRSPRSVGSVWFAILVLGISSSALAVEPEIGTLTAARGMIAIKRTGAGELNPAVIDAPVRIGDVVETGMNAAAQLTLSDGSFMNIGPGTRIRVSQYAYDEATTRRTAIITLLAGKARCVTFQLRSSDSSLRVETAEALVVADMLSDFIVESNPGSTTVAVLDKGVSVRNRSSLIVGEARLGINQKSMILEKTPPSYPATITPQERKDYLREFRKI